jgi:hypothetical protein
LVIIDAMTTTPDDQDWLRLADEAFITLGR